MMCPSGVMMTPAPEPGALGTRSGVNSRPFPVRLMGKRLTTEGLAASANSVKTVCISSRSRKPLDVLGGSPAGSAPLATGTAAAIPTTSDTTMQSRNRMKVSVPQVGPKTYKGDGTLKVHEG